MRARIGRSALPCLRSTNNRKQGRRRHDLRFLEPLEPRALLSGVPLSFGADLVALGIENPPGYTDAQLTVASALPVQNGYSRTSSPTTALSGTADAAVTGSVLVSGQPATWSPGAGTWSAPSVALKPGINRVVVESYTGAAGAGTRIDYDTIDVWYDTSGGTGATFSFPRGSVWEYLDTGSNQGTAWRTTDPNPPWATGVGQLGFGDGDETTTVQGGPSNNRFITTYFRRKFTIPAGQAALFTQISLDFLRDDGGCVYINGVEVVRTTNLPGTLGDNAVSFSTLANFNGAAATENLLSTFIVPAALMSGLLHDGQNVIAVEIHQHDAASSDISFDLGLTAVETTGVGGTNVSGTLPAGTTTWIADNGPYTVTGDITVPASATLVIQPGTTVFFNSGTGLTVNGRLLAEGTPYSRIQLTRPPTSSSQWDGIRFTNSLQDSRLTYFDMGHGDSQGEDIRVDHSQLLIDHGTWYGTPSQTIIEVLHPSLTVKNSIIPGISSGEAIHGQYIDGSEYLVFDGNVFGRSTGNDDVFDFSGAERPGPVLQVLNNTFNGGGDDGIDLDGTDAHVEGNIFRGFHYNTTRTTTSNGIATGLPQTGEPWRTQITVVRNLFYDNDHAILLKEDAFLTAVNNVFADSSIAAVQFNEVGGTSVQGPGMGGYFDSNIFSGNAQLFRNTRPESIVDVHRSVVPTSALGLGDGNTDANPQFVNAANRDYHLLPGSPAIGTGFNGVDMGAFVPAGASISGEPPALTAETSATLTVGSPALISYRYRVNDGPWSAEFPLAAPIALANLSKGAYTVYVMGKNDAGVWQSEANATRSKTWTVQSAAAPRLTLATRDSFLPGVPILVRVEVSGDYGKPDRNRWDATATLSTNNPAVTLSTNQVVMRNGLGSALVTVTGSADFTLSADLGPLHVERALTSLAGAAQTMVSGTLAGASSSWSGVIHVTGDVIVPVGHTLTIQPGTLVLVDGTAAALSETGIDIEVRGAINSLGTAAHPVSFTATNPAAPWGEIRHVSAQPALYQFTDVTRAGHAPRGGHTNTGPAVRTTGSTIVFDHAAITDIAGKTMQGATSVVEFRDSLISRSVMGPEVDQSAFVFRDSYAIDMRGIYREDGVTDDDDGIYVHRQQTGQPILFVDSVVAGTDDDGIDSLGADVTIVNVIVRDCNNPNEDAKGVSLIEGLNAFDHLLLVNDKVGISIKAQTPDPITGSVTLDHATIVGGQIGIQAENKFGIPGAVLNYVVTNSIIRSPDAIRTDYAPAQIGVNYSDLTETWPGTQNTTADPVFISTATNDYHLQATSPAINAGDPAAPTDPDGTRADMGVFPFSFVTPASVVARLVFYNNSAWDGNDPAAGAADDAAIATDKTALLPGGAATLANYTSYNKGINGVMIDVANLAGTLTAGDFMFKTGNSNDAAMWTPLATAPSVSVRPGAGANGSARVSLIWSDGTIAKKWLQVSVLANANTGLTTPDVFYFGNAIGEAGNSAVDAQVNAADELAARGNPRNIANPAPITFLYDFNRDKQVNAADQLISRGNPTNVATRLLLITPTTSAGPAVAALAEAALGLGDPPSGQGNSLGPLAGKRRR